MKERANKQLNIQKDQSDGLEVVVDGQTESDMLPRQRMETLDNFKDFMKGK